MSENISFSRIVEKIVGPDIQDLRRYQESLEIFQHWRNDRDKDFHRLTRHRRVLYEWRTFHLMENDIQEMKLITAQRKIIAASLAYGAAVDKDSDPVTRSMPMPSKSPAPFLNNDVSSQPPVIPPEPWGSHAPNPQTAAGGQWSFPRPTKSQIGTGCGPQPVRTALAPVSTHSRFFVNHP
jgi:hypothetical protein